MNGFKINTELKFKFVLYFPSSALSLQISEDQCSAHCSDCCCKAQWLSSINRPMVCQSLHDFVFEYPASVCNFRDS